MNERISVIVPVYNVEKYLARCMDSIMEQTYTDLEIILVDDGSTDGCGKLCDQCAATDDRIKVIHKRNGGLSDARNAGLDIASGKYICFIDSDDYIKNNMVEVLFRRLKETNADMVLCGYQRIDEQGNLLDPLYACEAGIWNGDRFWKEMYGEYHILCVVAWNKLYRRELFEGVRYKKGVVFEDEYIIDLLVEKCRSIATVEEVLYMYRKREGSIMSDLNLKRKMDKIEFLTERAERLWEKKNQRLVEKTMHSNMMRMSEMSLTLASDSAENAEEMRRFGELKCRVDHFLTQICGESVSWWFRLNCVFFRKDMRLYLLWRNCYGKAGKILKKRNRGAKRG